MPVANGLSSGDGISTLLLGKESLADRTAAS
jgi:hypothetical protein